MIISHDPGIRPQKDVQVQRTENDIEIACDVQSTPDPKKAAFDQRLPIRPGFGTQGMEVLLWANYFTLVFPPDLALFRYDVEILPDDAGKKPTGKRLKRLIKLMIEEHLSAYRSITATDYKSNLICRVELPIEEEPYHVGYRNEKELDSSPNARAYQVRLRNTGILRLSELMDYSMSTQASALLESKEQMVQALNIVVGHHPKTSLGVLSVGANKHFDVSTAGVESMSLGAGLNAVRGFFVSVRAATARLLVNVQVKHTACYDEGPLGQLILIYLQESGRNMVKLANFLTKLRVQVTHIVKKTRSGHEIPRIKSITSLATPGDGNGLAHPPIVPKFASGAKEVKFFLDTSGGKVQGAAKSDGKEDKKTGEPGPERPQGSYISVYDFFQRSKYLPFSLSYDRLQLTPLQTTTLL